MLQTLGDPRLLSNSCARPAISSNPMTRSGQNLNKKISLLLSLFALLTGRIHRDRSGTTSSDLRATAAERGYVDLQPDGR